jgi:16S rRNA (cytosine1402-N4)-methyltransferase
MHKPVLLKEIIEILSPKENENFIDATFGLGSVSFEILKYTHPSGKILAFEWDPELYNLGVKTIKKIKMEKRIKLVNQNFKNLKKVVKEEGFSQIKGVVFDLGISNWHYQESKRGFSFKNDEFLDMRINPNIKITAFEIINYFSYKELVEIFKNYGEEKEAEKIAQIIIDRRKNKRIETSKQLSEIIAQVKKTRRKIHPATLVFMALRSFINDELGNLEKGLKEAYDVLDNGGKIVVLSFNGLEDKIIKNVFKLLKKQSGRIITKRVIKPTVEEIKKNPKARSAKLRAIEKN